MACTLGRAHSLFRQTMFQKIGFGAEYKKDRGQKIMQDGVVKIVIALTAIRLVAKTFAIKGSLHISSIME